MRSTTNQLIRIPIKQPVWWKVRPFFLFFFRGSCQHIQVLHSHTRSQNCRLLRSKQFASTQPYCFVTLACVLVKFSVFRKQHLRVWGVTLRWCSKFCQVHWRRLAARKGLFLRYLKAQVATFYMYILCIVLVYVYMITVILDTCFSCFSFLVHPKKVYAS